MGAVAGETRLTGRDIGAIEITDKFSLVEVPADAVDEVVNALRATRIKGNRSGSSGPCGTSRLASGPRSRADSGVRAARCVRDSCIVTASEGSCPTATASVACPGCDAGPGSR